MLRPWRAATAADRKNGHPENHTTTLVSAQAAFRLHEGSGTTKVNHSTGRVQTTATISRVRNERASSPGSRIATCGPAPYPARRTASNNASGSPAFPFTVAVRVARLTLASVTPSTEPRARSTVVTHEAHVMPWMSSVTSRSSVSAAMPVTSRRTGPPRP